MTINTGSNVSKSTGYAVLGLKDGAVILKSTGYAVLAIEDKINVSKGIGYAVLKDATVSASRPLIMCLT